MPPDFDGPFALTGMPLALHPFVLGYEPIAESLSVRGGREDLYLLEPVTAAAVEYADGWILIDTGFNVGVVRDDALRAEFLNYDGYTPVVPPGDPLRRAVAAAGLEWDALAGCAISHAHLDHTCGVPTLDPVIPVVVQRKEWEWVAAGVGRREVVIPADLLGSAGSVRLLDGDTVLASGLRALDTAGHTPGHQSFVIELPRRTVVLACDAADLHVNLSSRTPCGWTPGEEGMEFAQRAIDRLADLAADGAHVWPGHDPEWGPWRAAMRGESVVVN